MASRYESMRNETNIFYRNEMEFSDDSKVENLSYRRRFRKFFFSSTKGLIITSLEVISSLIWCALYIIDTYYKNTPTYIFIWDWIFVALFTILYIMHLFASENRPRYIVSAFAVIDYVTILPYFLSFTGVTFLKIFSVLRIFRLIRVLSLAPNSIVRRIMQISFMIVAFLFIASALILAIEPDTFQNFHTSLYFVVVTIFTVGFGDLTPSSPFARAAVIAIIITAVILIPLLGYSISTLINSQPEPYMGKYNPLPDTKHLIIFGQNIRASQISEMTSEFFFKYRLQRKVDMHIVIMQKVIPSKELLKLTKNEKDENSFVHLLYGDPLSYKDMERASIKHAECAITLFYNDYDSCLVNMSIKSFNPSLPIYVMLQKPENIHLYLSVAPVKINRDDPLPTIIPKLEISAALISRSIQTKGFSTLITNLARTRMVTRSLYEEHHIEYRSGAGFEIYFGVLSTSFASCTFSQIAFSIYSNFNALLIGIVTDTKYPVINPADLYTIQGQELGIFIASDPSISTKVKDFQLLPLNTDNNNFDVVVLPEKRTDSFEYPKNASIPKYDIIRYHHAVENVTLLSEQYYISENPKSFEQANLKSISVSKHIILYGDPEIDWIYFIAPLRSKTTKQKHIFILTLKPISQTQWDSIKHFPDVFHISGLSLLNEVDNVILNISNASNLILLSKPIKNEFEEKIENVPNTVDDETRQILIIYAFITYKYPKVGIIVDIDDEYNLRFLHKSEHSIDPHILQEIRKGSACSTSATLERLLAQTVFNPLVYEVILHLIFGTRYVDVKKHLMPLISLENISPSFIGKPYGELFEFLLNSKFYLPLGLYRSKERHGHNRNDDYVSTCPPSQTVIEPNDRVYIIFPQTL